MVASASCFCLGFGALNTADLAQAETRLGAESGESVTLRHVAYAPMEPVFQTAPALPTGRPDPARAYPAAPVSISLPASKPALAEILP
ncbi:MAG: hypothetical protein ACO20L_10385, partial [Candidatus Puniceispirillaceae bacterium]